MAVPQLINHWYEHVFMRNKGMERSNVYLNHSEILLKLQQLIGPENLNLSQLSDGADAADYKPHFD